MLASCEVKGDADESRPVSALRRSWSRCLPAAEARERSADRDTGELDHSTELHPRRRSRCSRAGPRRRPLGHHARRAGGPERSPSGRTMEASASRWCRPRDPNPEPDPVFFLAGGPGGAATQSWSSAPLVFPGVHAHRDIVLVDQRGTGDSNLLLWPEPPTCRTSREREVREMLIPWVREAIAELGADPRLYASSPGGRRPRRRASRARLRPDRPLRRLVRRDARPVLPPATRGARPRGRARRRDPARRPDPRGLIPKSSQDALDSVFARCAADPACNAAFPSPAAGRARNARWPGWRDIRSAPTSSRPVDGRADRGGRRGPRRRRSTTCSWSATAPTCPWCCTRPRPERIEPIAERIRDASEDPSTSAKATVMYWSIACAEGWARFDPGRTARPREPAPIC